ncbi:hypothetical protein ACTFIY_001222 [Dictyostelium cf. discoideum]
MVFKFSVNGKALSGLTLDEIFSEIRNRDPTISPYLKKSILRNKLRELLEHDLKNKNNNNNNNNNNKNNKRPLGDDDDDDDEKDDKNIEDNFEKSLDRLILKFKNKRMKYEKENSSKSQETINELKNENSKLLETIKILKCELEIYSSINNNNNKEKCLKLYKKVMKQFKISTILYSSLSIKETDEFIKFMVIKVIENDLGNNNNNNNNDDDYDDKIKLLPPPSIESYWKKMVNNSVKYKEFLKIIGKEIHFKLPKQIYKEKVKHNSYLREKYEYTLKLYSNYFPESSIIHLNKNNNESIWPLNYLSPSNSSSDSSSEESNISPPITSPPINIFSTCFLPPGFGSSSSSSLCGSSSVSSSASSTPCSSPLISKPILRSNSTTTLGSIKTIDIIIESKTENLYCRVPIKQKFSEILKSFSKRYPNLKYYYYDHQVYNSDSPKSLDMDDDDIIEAREEVLENLQKEIVQEGTF